MRYRTLADRPAGRVGLRRPGRLSRARSSSPRSALRSTCQQLHRYRDGYDGGESERVLGEALGHDDVWRDQRIALQICRWRRTSAPSGADRSAEESCAACAATGRSPLGDRHHREL